MSLPPEIRHEIADLVAHSQFTPSGSWSRELNYDGFHRLLTKESPFSRFPGRKLDFQVAILLNLRLVSRDWNQTATVLLRQHCWWPLKFDWLKSLERASSLCHASSVLPSAIGKLDFRQIDDVLTFQRVWEGGFPGSPDPDDTETPPPGFTEHPQYKRRRSLPREDGRPLEMHYDKSAEHRILRGLFDKLGRIHGLSLHFPGATYDGHDPQTWVQCYDTVALDEIAATVQYGLALPAWEHLVQLRLVIPCTRDVYRFTHTMSSEARGRLRHLAIHITDETDDAGNSLIENTGDSDDDVADGVASVVNIPASNLQIEFPNKAHQSYLWDFVASCPNLESLCVAATHYLDLDQLKWHKPSRSRGFRALYLDRVYTSIPSIIELLCPHPESKGCAQLRFLELHDVKVHTNGGNWSDLFAYLASQCPDLALCIVEQLTYFSAHPNYEENGRIWENYREIWSDRGEDMDELRELTRKLVRKAGGRGSYWESMESLLEQDEEFEPA